MPPKDSQPKKFVPSKCAYYRFRDGKLIHFMKDSVVVINLTTARAYKKNDMTGGKWVKMSDSEMTEHFDLRKWKSQAKFWNDDKYREKSLKSAYAVPRKHRPTVQSRTRNGVPDNLFTAVEAANAVVLQEPVLLCDKEDSVVAHVCESGMVDTYYKPRFMKNGQEDPIKQALDFIGKKDVDLISQYRTEPHNYSAWRTFRFIRTCGDAGRDLIRSNPAIAFLLIQLSGTIGLTKHKKVRKEEIVDGKCNGVSTRLFPKTAYQRRWVKWTQKRILKKFGFPATKSAVSIFKKIIPSSLSWTQFTGFRNLLNEFHPVREEMIQYLQHVPKIDLSLIVHWPCKYVDILGNRTACEPTRELMADMVKQSNKGRSARNLEICIRDTALMLDRVQTPVADEFRRLRSFQELKDLHDRLAQQVNIDEEGVCSRSEITELPSPPFPGNEYVYPISTVGDLEIEGRTMHHCVVSYDYYIAKGQSYIYHVETRVQDSTEKATVEIKKYKDRKGEEHWYLGQAHSVCNKQVHPVLAELIHKWCEEVGVSYAEKELEAIDRDRLDEGLAVAARMRVERREIVPIEENTHVF